MMKTFILAGAIALSSALPALAGDIIKIKTGKSVSEAINALEAMVGKAGATVFARVDHAAGAKSVGQDIPASELLIFGNPKLGTPAMQIDPLAGLFLPLKVLAYEDATGQVWLAYEDPKETLDDLGDLDKAPVVGKMQGALQKLTAAAAN